MIKWGKLIKQTGLSCKAILKPCEKQFVHSNILPHILTANGDATVEPLGLEHAFNSPYNSKTHLKALYFKDFSDGLTHRDLHWSKDFRENFCQEVIINFKLVKNETQVSF